MQTVSAWCSKDGLAPTSRKVVVEFGKGWWQQLAAEGKVTTTFLLTLDRLIMDDTLAPVRAPAPTGSSLSIGESVRCVAMLLIEPCMLLARHAQAASFLSESNAEPCALQHY
jgi:hypothetical protein